MDFILNIFLWIGTAISSVLPFIILLGILVFIHELGHFLVARFCGVKVEVFSLGFGKKILQYKKGDTVYCLSLFPLGGYVKMFGHEYGQKISESDKSVAFLYKSVWQRMAIVIAGPLMNFFLAIVIFTSLSIYTGDKKIRPVVGELNSTLLAKKSGFVYGDYILSVNKTSVQNINQVKNIIFKNPNTPINIKVKTKLGKIQIRKVTPTLGPSIDKWGFSSIGGVIEGLTFSTPAAYIGVMNSKSRAGLAGFKTFDHILSVNGTKIKNRKQLFTLLNNPSFDNNVSWNIKLKRGKETKNLVLKKPKYFNSSDGISQLGLTSSDLFISDLTKKGAAIIGGLKKGDLIFKINNQKILSWDFLVKKIRNFKSEQGALKIEIKRDGKSKQVSLIPDKTTILIKGIETKYYRLGIVGQSPHVFMGSHYIEKQSNVLTALAYGLNSTLHWCNVVIVYIKKFITGEISRKTLGGAISIGRVAYDTYSYGLEYFFKIMAILSVQLFLLNILPIPIFDGGHLLFYIIEAIKGSPLSVKKIMIAQQVGVFFLLILLIFTTFNDLHNWFFI